MEGGCYCGGVRYRLLSEPIFVNACHCRDCQKLTGSAFAVNALIEDDRIERLKGVPVKDAKGCFRCSACNTLLWASHPMFGDNIRFVRAGTLDESEKLLPNAHFFVRSKHSWVTLPEGVTTFDTLPAEGEIVLDALQQVRVTAAMSPL